MDRSEALSIEEKQSIKEKQARRINSEGYLRVFAQEYRSQTRNKELAVRRFYHYLEESLKTRKKRVKTKPSKKAVEKRLQGKKAISKKKALRGRVD